ncbi:MAG TPA: PAS domain-containing protein [Planktothrix sp. UBA8407]|jgi:PAS domain S-box|nr:PAS domain-containing protein [Planktothrix sp. UBA8402]HAO13275.1 PAS domain-containing protein [Planktothrix sp. UBA8407]HBK25060.1 PAS domain-containing protein [Planktothrix sp. UBA10369]
MDINTDKFKSDILVVDDNIDNIRFLSDFLIQQGYQVRKAINGNVALMAAKTLIPDLILLDINMPGIGGYQVCEELKNDEKTSSTPIIFLSAGDDIKDKVKAFEAGGVDYITKPFQLEEVLIRVQTQLKLQALQKTLKTQNQALEKSEAEIKALFKAMKESILVFDSDGHYLKVVTPNTKLLYHPEQERIGKTIHDILPQKQADILLGGIKTALATQETIEVEYSLIIENKKTDLSVNISPISSNSVLSVMRDISDRKRREEALKLIVEGTASKTGAEFFRSCVRGLAEILGVRYTIVTECIDPQKNRVRTLAFWVDQDFIDNIEYDLEGLPCDLVVTQGEYYCYTDDVISHFPESQILADLKAHSYAGIPLIDSMGNVIGNIAILDTNPMVNDETRELVLRIFAARAGAELERKNTDKALQESQERSEKLLLNILPKSIAERLKHDTSAIAEKFDEVTILFADIVGFTPLSTRIQPDELVNRLNQVFSVFDQLTEKHGLEKIKTIGDAYMVVGGLPIPKENHAESVAQIALDMQLAIANFQTQYNEPLQIRIGINTGSVIAGVIGVKKFIYDLWGDAVNVASRMESSGLPGKIQVTEATYQRLKNSYVFEKRGQIEVKGRGEMTTYWLIQ